MATDLRDTWQHLQRQLFPMLLEEVGELGEKDHLFVRVISLLPLGQWLERYDWCGIGCPPAFADLDAPRVYCEGSLPIS
jgi:hypothetical protein